MLPVSVRVRVRVLVVVRMIMVVRVKSLVRVGVRERLRWLPPRQVTVSAPVRMAMNMRPVPVARLDGHPREP